MRMSSTVTTPSVASSRVASSVPNTLFMSVFSAPGPPTSTLSPPPPSAMSRTPSTKLSRASSSCPGWMLETGYIRVEPSSDGTPRASPVRS